MDARRAIGIDLGGTNLRWGVIDSDGNRLIQEHKPRPKEPDDIVKEIRLAVAFCRERHAVIDTVGVAVPGIVGETITSINLGWLDFPLAEKLADLPARVSVLNDMAAGALGELHFGRARGMRNIVFVTVSTGIGSGVIVNGQVYNGAHSLAGEAGHMVVDLNGLLCGCGRRGCWEMIASGTAHRRRIHEAFASGTWPNEETEPTPADVTERARGGDRAARALVLRTARYIGIGVTNLVNLYDPEAVIFTGGFARNNWDLIDEYLEQEVHEQAFSQSVRLLLTELGDDAGLVGAAAYALQERAD